MAAVCLHALLWWNVLNKLCHLVNLIVIKIYWVPS